MASMEPDKVEPESKDQPTNTPAPQTQGTGARRGRLRFIGGGCVVAALGLVLLRGYLAVTPLVKPGPGMLKNEAFDGNSKLGRVVMSVMECAERQKGLFGYIEIYRQKNGHVPQSIDALIADNPHCTHFIHCPLESSYTIHPAAYGNPNAIFISEDKCRHPTTFGLWIRSTRPCVRTMGDGTIRMFEGAALQMSLSAQP